MKKRYVFKEQKQQIERKQTGGKLLLCSILFVCFLVVISQFFTTELFQKIKYETCYASLQNLSPILMKQMKGDVATSTETYQTKAESTLKYKSILAGVVSQENKEVLEADAAAENQAQQVAGTSMAALDKLKDFDYLVQNYFTVDKTTTITSDKLDIETLLAKDCTLGHDASTPQILIYHTHSQEGYLDSVPGDLSMSVVGVGDYLTQILTETYGYSVIHHTGIYDLDDRSDAYNLAGYAVEQILEENPSIEVVIDLHRDGVPDTTRLACAVNGKSTAQIMFFNGLSHNTTVGDIDYLYNPYIQDNLAFSMQLQLASVEQYPGFSRKIYLKGYRYNLHYRPKSLLIEVGAQTNTLEEAKNAMEPFAAILHQVLSGK